MSKADLIEAQKKDNTIQRVVEAMQRGKWPKDKETDTEMTLMKRERDRLVLKDGLLPRTSKKPSGEQVTQLVLPAEFQGAVLLSLHDDMGHLGVERTTDLQREKPDCQWIFVSEPHLMEQETVVEKLKGDLQEAYQLASQAADKMHQRNKRAYDQRVRFQTVDTGDRVLLKNLGLRDREWERTHRSYKEYMDKLLQRRTYDEPATAGSSEEEHEPSVQDPSEEEEVSIREEDNKVSACEEVSDQEEHQSHDPDDRSEEESQSEDDDDSDNTTDSGRSESELEQEVPKHLLATLKLSQCLLYTKDT
ncbi:hypothetical protein AAFF_G00223010 [Aldrovandia affinis]|uniref:Uncharacterized protein n=1 Tax=Aldrovandia affinis TaxID=143900 RepID=A0AAD7W3T9_9TELE|nr:hypothetical protein AAFF_G00223010 [Aldrovandia affinis]